MSSPTDNTTLGCGFHGDDNVYGLGVRLGVYFQWLATAVALNAVPEQSAQVETVNLCFQLSVLVALIYATAAAGYDGDGVGESGGAVHAIKPAEAYLIYILCIGGVFSRRGLYSVVAKQSQLSTIEKEQWWGPKQRSTPAGIAASLIINLAIFAYGLWLVYYRLDSLRSGGCPSEVFFFGRVNLFGGFRIFLRVVLTVGAAYVLYQACVATIAVGLLVQKEGISSLFIDVFKPRNKFVTEEPHIGGPKLVPAQKEKTWICGYMVPLDLAFFVLTIEFTITWNGISGVNELTSTGQLIPLIVGATALLTMIYEVIVKVSDDQIRKYRVPTMVSYQSSGRSGSKVNDTTWQGLRMNNSHHFRHQ